MLILKNSFHPGHSVGRGCTQPPALHTRLSGPKDNFGPLHSSKLHAAIPAMTKLSQRTHKRLAQTVRATFKTRGSIQESFYLIQVYFSADVLRVTIHADSYCLELCMMQNHSL
jgi:hypothetical protein